VFWLPNNNFEIYYLNINGIYPPMENTFVLRPYGVLEKVSNNLRVSSKSVIYVHSYFFEDARFLNNFKSLNKTKYELFYMGNYGGPSFLKKHKLFIYFPYQYSTMKVFNNAINEILTVVPSSQFFKQIALEYSEDFYLMPELFNLFQRNPLNWTEYFDVYNRKYTGMFLKFNSWPQLHDLINNDNDVEINLKKSHYLQKGKKIMKQHWNEVDIEWKRFFNRLNSN